MSRKPNPELIDDDNPEWSDEMVKHSVRLSGLPSGLQAKLRTPRGPQKAPRKVSTTIRLSPEVVQHFRAMGDGWQSQIDTVLKDWVAHHA